LRGANAENNRNENSGIRGSGDNSCDIDKIGIAHVTHGLRNEDNTNRRGYVRNSRSNRSG
jgi:hypothetical protein